MRIGRSPDTAATPPVVGVGQVVGQGFFAEDVETCVKSRDRHLTMQIVRDGDHHSVEAAGGDHLAIVGEDPCAAELLGNLRGALAVAATDRSYFRVGITTEARYIHQVDPPARADDANPHLLRHGPPLPRPSDSIQDLRSSGLYLNRQSSDRLAAISFTTAAETILTDRWPNLSALALVS